MEGMVYTGCMFVMTPTAVFFAVLHPNSPAPEDDSDTAVLPLGHPERLTPEVPPTDEETRLWSELRL